MAKRKMSESDKFYLTTFQSSSIESLCAATGLDKDVVGEFLSSVKPNVEPVKSGFHERNGTVVMTQEASIVGDESKKYHPINERTKNNIHIIKPGKPVL